VTVAASGMRVVELAVALSASVADAAKRHAVSLISVISCVHTAVTVIR